MCLNIGPAKSSMASEALWDGKHLYTRNGNQFMRLSGLSKELPDVHLEGELCGLEETVAALGPNNSLRQPHSKWYGGDEIWS